jgi:hypothetical protein
MGLEGDSRIVKPSLLLMQTRNTDTDSQERQSEELTPE